MLTTVLENMPNTPGVYAIRGPRRRAYPSDIIYIGSAANARGLHGRIHQYFHPGSGQRTARRIHQRITTEQDLEISYSTTDTWADAKCLEAQLLYRFETSFGCLPEENKRR